MRLFVSSLKLLSRVILSFADRLFRHYTALANTSLLAAMLTDLPRSRVQLLAENALVPATSLIRACSWGGGGQAARR